MSEWLCSHLVMADADLHFDEVVGIEVVVFGEVVVVPCETLDGVGVVPERQHLEMGYICFSAVETPRAAISARCLILGEGDPPHKIQVVISFRNGNLSVPYSGDHIIVSFHQIGAGLSG